MENYDLGQYFASPNHGFTLYLGSNAFWSEEWTSYLLEGNQLSF
jgi:hypothetical protein